MKANRPTLKVYLFFYWVLSCTILNGQDTINLQNPSFEDSPRRGTPGMLPIKGWNDCSHTQFPQETPPDIHPVQDIDPAKENAWGVSMLPQDGETYLGLVVRANATWESVSQQLIIPLRADSCYSLTAMLALSDTYKSATAMTQKLGTYELESFANPVMLVVWGGGEECDKYEIIAESGEVANHQWAPYHFLLTPHNDYTHITIEAYYLKSSETHYNGHIMVDHLSSIIEVNCK